jgi:hypothetical protein
MNPQAPVPHLDMREDVSISNPSERQDARLDEELDTFPASDPIPWRHDTYPTSAKQ